MKSAPDISSVPFLKLLLIVIAGIVTADVINMPVWIMPAFTVAAGISAWLSKDTKYGGILTPATLMFFAMSITHLTATRDVMPKGERMVMVMSIADNPEISGRWSRVSAIVDRYRPLSSDGEYTSSTAGEKTTARESGYTAGSSWGKSGEKIMARFDTAFRVSAGDRIITAGYIGDLGGENYESYVRLMRRRGYSAAAVIGGRENPIILPGKARTSYYFIAGMQSAAAERLSRLDLRPGEAALTKAMALGMRQSMDKSLKESYGITGATHLLAVSGLNVGMVAAIVNLLLYLLPTFRRGHIIKNIAAISAIWLYAMLTGLSPSIVRAAAMFTGVQLALALSQKGSGGMNMLLATATIMLLINPNNLYDISFQLSFVAVLGIFMLYKPLFSLVKCRYKIINAVWAAVIVGTAASLATAPLVSFYFGRIPVIGILMNPLAIATAYVIVQFSILWIIIPIGFLNGIFSRIIGFSADMQNRIVEFCAEKSWAAASVSLNGWQTAAVYLLLLAVYFIVRYDIYGTKGGFKVFNTPR